MEHKKFSESELFEGATNKTYEYNFKNKDINFCIVDIKGRFPVKGLAINKKCNEMAHVLAGSGFLMVEGKKYNLKQDDVVIIEPGEKYYWVGEMRLGVPCAPAWTPTQHETVEEENW